LFENQSTYISRVKWTPYVFIGLAAFLHNPQAMAPDQDFLHGNHWLKVGNGLPPSSGNGRAIFDIRRPDANHGIKPYSLIQVAIPFGVGARLDP